MSLSKQTSYESNLTHSRNLAKCTSCKHFANKLGCPDTLIFPSYCDKTYLKSAGRWLHLHHIFFCHMRTLLAGRRHQESKFHSDLFLTAPTIHGVQRTLQVVLNRPFAWYIIS